MNYFKHLCSMRIFLSSLFLLLSLTVLGQSKWEYGLNLNFNTSFVKGVSSDTFTNKAGFGAGLMLERKFNKFSLQFNPSYTQTRYNHDFANFTSISNAFDASLLAVHPIDASGQTVVNYGVITTYNLLYDEHYLSGLNPDIRNTDILANPFNMGIQFGVGLDLNPGARLTVNYMDFLNGKQHPGKIVGQIDYLQFGIQIRFNELLNSKSVNNKYDAAQAQIERANQNVEDLKHGGNGLLVFVIRTAETKKVGLFDSKSPEERDSLRKVRLFNIKEAIRTNYQFGSYVITTDSLLEPRSETLMILTEDSVEKFNTASKNTLYYAKIDELFLEHNGQVKWGIFVFDSGMNLLEEPFPYFTPYRQFDQIFETSETMIQSFNLRLKQYSVTAD